MDYACNRKKKDLSSHFVDVLCGKKYHKKKCKNPYSFVDIEINILNSVTNLEYISVADPGFCGFLTPGSGMGKKSGSGMNNPYHIFQSLETIFWVL